MRGLTIEKIEQVTGGALHISVLTKAGIFASFDRATLRKGGPRARWIWERILPAEAADIVTDSRRAGRGSLFGAIVGERVDGHRFIPRVFDQGALSVLTEKRLEKENLFSAEAEQMQASLEVKNSDPSEWKDTVRRRPKAGERPAEVPDPSSPAPDGSLYRAWIEVEDTQEALRKIAEEYLKILKVPVVGITGSVGKTSTKEMIASVLSTHFRTLKTEGNFNNGLGLPLTVFRLTDQDQIAVLEMGVSHFGDMDQLARIARPDTMVITNIGTCHLEFLKDRDGILRAKTEVFRYMKPSARAILFGNDDKLRTVFSVNGQAPVWFGVASDEAGAAGLSAGAVMDFPGDLDPAYVVCADQVEPLGFEGSSCRIRTPRGDFRVKVPVPGLHNVANAAAAAAVGIVRGLSFDEIREGIESMKTISGRFRIVKTKDMTVIDDCYNANPVSMRSSLEVLSKVKGRRVAILGDMGELGKDEVLMHRQVGKFSASCCDHLIAVGELSGELRKAAKEENKSLSSSWYPDAEAFLQKAETELKPGDTVLVKASHFMGFTRIVNALTEDN